MSARTQRRQQNRRARKPQPPTRPVSLWRYAAVAALLLLTTLGALAASTPPARTGILAHISALAAPPTPSKATPAKTAPAVKTAAYAAPPSSSDPPPAAAPSQQAAPIPAASDDGDWLLAPDNLPAPPPTGDFPPLPVAHSAQDLGFHPVKAQHMECVGDRVIITCLNPETGGTETITGKRGRDTVTTLKNPDTSELPTRQIKDVEPGNLVATRNPQTGKTQFGRVVRTIQRQTDALVTVRLADSKTGQAASSLTCTPEHPYYVQGKGWVEAGSLGIGSSIVTRAGPPLVVKGVDWQRAKAGTKPFTVYNFEVAGSHTYFVGKDNGGAWVHNSCGDVINETMAGRGNITSAHTLTTDEALEGGEQFLGKDGYNEIGRPGSGVYRSQDGLRQFRMDSNSLLGNHSPNVPHVHFEIYPPGGRLPIVNNHVPIIP